MGRRTTEPDEHVQKRKAITHPNPNLPAGAFHLALSAQMVIGLFSQLSPERDLHCLRAPTTVTIMAITYRILIISGPSPRTSHGVTPSALTKLFEVGTTKMPISHTRKLRHRKST